MKTRVRVIMTSLACLFLMVGIASAQQVMLDGTTIPKFVDPLPVAGDITVVDATELELLGEPGTPEFNIHIREFQSQILPAALYGPSWVWGYLTDDDVEALSSDPGLVRPSFLGPVVVAERGVPAAPTYLNELPLGSVSNVLPLLPIDQTLDWANPYGTVCADDPFTCFSPYLRDQIPVAAHLHGGEVAPAYDGGPDAWFTQGNETTGDGFPGNTYDYPNEQQESTIWFHDHALGITRLNVYAGLAGVYPIIDPDNPPLATMPAFPQYDIPLILQDRSFDTSGQIFYNLASNPQPNIGVHPYWIPEFIGDTIVVNGKTWPYLDVEPRQYRFRLVNGSNARFYDLSMRPGLKFDVIATDDGYLQTAVRTRNVVIGPGERYEVIVDFSKMRPGKNVVMYNAARTPFPGGEKPTRNGTDTVMQFRVRMPLSRAVANTTIVGTDIAAGIVGTTIRPTPLEPIVDGFDPVNGIRRQLTLNEVIGAGGPLELVVNNSKFNLAGILPGCTTPLCRETELPAIGDTEIWEIINISADAHPMHTHLVSFQIIDRTPFRASQYMTQYDALLFANGVPDGGGPPNQYNIKNADGAIGGNPGIGQFLRLDARKPPLPYEMGWKDTAIMYPGEVTRIAVRWATTDTPVGDVEVGDNTYAPAFDPTDLQGPVGYVWHCHIIDHEDNEMMRNYVVGSERQSVCPFGTVICQ
jgi:FtsP/CotA-like multicopper oxidase with cupredoxin domain